MAAKLFGEIWNKLCDGCASELVSEMDAADLGLSRDDALTFLRARPGVSQQSADMAARLGLTEADIQKEHWRAVDIARACSQCKSSKSCANFLSGRQSDFTIEACPNFDRFVELAIEEQAPAT